MRTKWVLSPERQRKKNAGWVIHLKRENISLSFVNGVSHDQYFCLWRIVWKHIHSYLLDKFIYMSLILQLIIKNKNKTIAHENNNLTLDFPIIYWTEYYNRFAVYGLYYIRLNPFHMLWMCHLHFQAVKIWILFI